MDTAKLYMIIFLAIYFFLILGLRSLMLYFTDSINAIEGFGNSGENRKAERIIIFALLLMIIISINFIFLPSNYKYLIPLDFLQENWVATIGFASGLFGFILAFVAQIQMQSSWRIGIDVHADNSLIRSGLFKYSRNPVYLGLALAFIGYFFIAPNVLSIVFLFTMFQGVLLKIRDEEKYLESKYGEEYSTYKSKVKRWI